MQPVGYMVSRAAGIIYAQLEYSDTPVILEFVRENLIVRKSSKILATGVEKGTDSQVWTPQESVLAQ